MTHPASPSVDHVELRPGAYADSVALLQVSTNIAALPEVLAAQVAMATPLNLEVISGMGFTIPEATPNDMVIAVRLTAAALIPDAVAAVEAALARTRRGPGGGGPLEVAARTSGSAIERSGAGLAFVSVPGASATVEAVDAIEAGRDVMIFSDNVPLDEEIALKALAARRDVLVMGPDCGTAVVSGVGLGFANAVRPGPVGIVAASGTGCQQLLALLDHAGVGITAALGVGGRDLSAAVGGSSTRLALRRLDADPATELIVVVSKPPAEDVAAELRAHAAGLSTPVQFALLGAGQPDLTQAAESVLVALGRQVPSWPSWQAAGPPVTPAAGLLRGLFAGGTLCDEAMLIAQERLGPVWSNIPLETGHPLGATLDADGPVLIDFGSDEMTRGRAHPMIDPTIRLEHLARVAADPRVGVVLLDVILGHGADPDPAASLGPAIRRAVAGAREAGRRLAVVVACVGTSGDPQGLTRQAQALADAGAQVHLSNADAARAALTLIGAAS